MTDQQLKAKTYALRRDVLDMIYHGKTGHIGGDYSVIDILSVLYLKQMNINPQNITNPNRDRFILSKGHSVEALYSVLAEKGFFAKEELNTFGEFGSKFIGHPTKAISGIEMNSGSLGHGLPVAVGMAIAGKKDKLDYRVYTVMGDGELAEGSVWEGVMAAGHFGLDNLTAVIDRNGLQISGTTEEIMAHDDQATRWTSFGWNTIKTDGHSIAELNSAFEAAKKHKGQPTVIIAHTTKGYGVSFMENKPGWHHRVPTDAEYKEAMLELTQKEARVL